MSPSDNRAAQSIPQRLSDQFAFGSDEGSGTAERYRYVLDAYYGHDQEERHEFDDFEQLVGLLKALVREGWRCSIFRRSVSEPADEDIVDAEIID